MEPKKIGTKLLVAFAVCAGIGLAITEGDAATYTLSITKAGTGTGTVFSADGRHQLRSICTADMAKGNVSLWPRPGQVRSSQDGPGPVEGRRHAN